MFNKNPLRYFTLTIAVLALAGLSACKKKDETQQVNNTQTETTAKATVAKAEVILIGEVGSMTGNEATFGTSTHQGIELAVKQLNENGGINGKKIALKSYDDQGKPEEAATLVNKLITQDKVIAILGEVASSRSLAMAPIAQQNQIPMVSPSSTNPKVTEQGNYIFRVCFIDPFQGAVMAKFALENLGLKKVAILRDVKNDYSVGLADFFTLTFTKGGGEIVEDQSYSAGDVDFKSQLTSINFKNPEAVFVPGYYTEVGLIARQAKELGITAPLMGGDGWDSPKLTEIGGDSINGSYFSNHYSNEDTSPTVQNFITQYKAAYGTVPDGLAAMGYDAMMVLADAMTRSASLKTSDIRDALAATKEFAGVTGTISIDEHRNAIKSAVVLKVDNGNYKFQAKLDP